MASAPKLPAAHAEHENAPGAAANEPAVQFVHVVRACADALVP
jgi:hypothetical protein